MLYLPRIFEISIKTRQNGDVTFSKLHETAQIRLREFEKVSEGGYLLRHVTPPSHAKLYAF